MGGWGGGGILQDNLVSELINVNWPLRRVSTANIMTFNLLSEP